MPAPQIRDMLPAQNFRDDESAGGSLAAFVDQVLQPVLDLMWDDADRFGRQNDPDLADANAVGAMLLDLGCPFPLALALPLPKQRSLVRSLLKAYKQFGTALGLVEIVRALTGIEITQVVVPARNTGWILGVNVLADTSSDPYDPSATNLAILSNTASNAFSFQVVTDRTLTAAEEALVRDVVRQVKPAHTHFYGFIPPSSATPPAQWDVGVSELGSDTNLG